MVTGLRANGPPPRGSSATRSAFPLLAACLQLLLAGDALAQSPGPAKPPLLDRLAVIFEDTVETLTGLFVWKHAISAGMVIVLVAVLALPVVRFLWIGAAQRRKELLSYFDDDLIREYFKQYLPNEKFSSGVEARAKFEIEFSNPRKMYFSPLALLLIVALLEAIAAVGTALSAVTNGTIKADIALPEIAFAAVAGGYMWVTYELIGRGRRQDLTPSDLNLATLRLVISIPIGYAFAKLASPDLGRFVAFALGAFPFAPLLAFLRKAAAKRLEIDETTEANSDQIALLQGVDSEIAERLQNADLRTISQLATADPVRVAVRTNLSFTFVLDLMSQSLAWMYLSDKLNLLRPFGLRGAFEMKTLIDRYDDAGTAPEAAAARAKAAGLMEVLAKPLAQDVKGIEHVLREIAEDPYTIFLHRMWR